MDVKVIIDNLNQQLKEIDSRITSLSEMRLEERIERVRVGCEYGFGSSQVKDIDGVISNLTDNIKEVIEMKSNIQYYANAVFAIMGELDPTYRRIADRITKQLFTMLEENDVFDLPLLKEQKDSFYTDVVILGDIYTQS